MRGFRCTAVIFLAFACLASSFLFPPQPTTAAVCGSGTKRGNTRAVVTLPKITGTSLVHPAALPLAAPPASTTGFIMMVSPRGEKGMEDDGDGEKQSDGVETNPRCSNFLKNCWPCTGGLLVVNAIGYLVAAGVFVLAALYDLFVTHQGRLWEL